MRRKRLFVEQFMCTTTLNTAKDKFFQRFFDADYHHQTSDIIAMWSETVWVCQRRIPKIMADPPTGSTGSSRAAPADHSTVPSLPRPSSSTDSFLDWFDARAERFLKRKRAAADDLETELRALINRPANGTLSAKAFELGKQHRPVRLMQRELSAHRRFLMAARMGAAGVDAAEPLAVDVIFEDDEEARFGHPQGARIKDESPSEEEVAPFHLDLSEGVSLDGLFRVSEAVRERVIWAGPKLSVFQSIEKWNPDGITRKGRYPLTDKGGEFLEVVGAKLERHIHLGAADPEAWKPLSESMAQDQVLGLLPVHPSASHLELPREILRVIQSFLDPIGSAAFGAPVYRAVANRAEAKRGLVAHLQRRCLEETLAVRFINNEPEEGFEFELSLWRDDYFAIDLDVVAYVNFTVSDGASGNQVFHDEQFRTGKEKKKTLEDVVAQRYGTQECFTSYSDLFRVEPEKTVEDVVKHVKNFLDAHGFRTGNLSTKRGIDNNMGDLIIHVGFRYAFKEQEGDPGF